MESTNGDDILFVKIQIGKHGLGVTKAENLVSTITQHAQGGTMEHIDCQPTTLAHG